MCPQTGMFARLARLKFYRRPLLQRTMTVHPAAQTGFGSDTMNYEAARPEHQTPAVNHLLEKLAIPAGGRLVEIGSGTGKFTAHLLNRSEKWEVICVEPSEDMRKTHRKLQPECDIREGTAYKLPVEDASADAIVCAQAFHWFATAEALEEFARVLKPGGSLGLIWNVYDTSIWPEWQGRIFQEARTHEEGAPQYRTLEWKKAFDTPVAQEKFVLPLQQWEHKWTRWVDEQQIWDFLRSLSFIHNLSPEKKQIFKGHLEEYIREGDEKGQIERNERGQIEIPSKADVRWIKRK